MANLNNTVGKLASGAIADDTVLDGYLYQREELVYMAYIVLLLEMLVG